MPTGQKDKLTSYLKVCCKNYFKCYSNRIVVRYPQVCQKILAQIFLAQKKKLAKYLKVCCKELSIKFSKQKSGFLDVV